MRKTKTILLATTIPILSFVTINKEVKSNNYTEFKVTPKVKRESSIDTLYNKCINHLKEYESFSDVIYLDNDGSKTIGYGHHIQKGENFKSRISEKEADKILRKDFNKKLKWVKKQYKLDEPKSYALSLFCFNIGETKLLNSTLNKLIKSRKKIDHEIIKWKWFKHEGEMKQNKKLEKRRYFELSLFNLTKY